MIIEPSERVKKLSPYIFAQLEKLIVEKKSQGIDIISLSIGDPDIPPPPFILDALSQESSDPKNHNYSFSQGEPYFREAVAKWYKKRFGVDVDPINEVIALLGSKEGLANIARAFVNPMDQVLVPDPAYPVYSNGATNLCDGIPITMPLLEKNFFRPNLESIEPKNVKMMYLNYPNNPTGSVMNLAMLQDIVDFAKANNIILCYDNAYSEITFDGYKAPSILEADGGKDVAVEFNSCSKTFSMTGDRIGFAVGNYEIIDAFVRVKKQIDSGPSTYIQKVASKALDSYRKGNPPKYVRETIEKYSRRREALYQGLRHIGFKCEKPLGTFYVWTRSEGSSMEFCSKILNAGVVSTPGIGFGQYGEGYVRFSVTQSIERIKEACERLSEIL